MYTRISVYCTTHRSTSQPSIADICQPLRESTRPLRVRISHISQLWRRSCISHNGYYLLTGLSVLLLVIINFFIKRVVNDQVVSLMVLMMLCQHGEVFADSHFKTSLVLWIEDVLKKGIPHLAGPQKAIVGKPNGMGFSTSQEHLLRKLIYIYIYIYPY